MRRASRNHVHLMTSTSIIGGMFGLPELLASGATRPPFLGGNSLLLLNARCALRLLIERLAPPRTWMPSYLCPDMLAAVGAGHTALSFYPVDGNLTVRDTEWLRQVGPRDLVLLIAYFGFPSDIRCARSAKERGAWVVEDACQALLSEARNPAADFILFSPRKFLGVPDGGILLARDEAGLFDASLNPPPAGWWLKALEAAVQRREFDRHGGPRDWFRLFREIEAEFPIGAYAMSELAAALLRQGFDYGSVIRRRRENYRCLASELGEMAIFPDLPEDVVPLGFPVRVSERDRVRQALFDAGIYPPVHWEILRHVPPEFGASHRLAGDILTLLCDQRYGRDHMERQVSRLRACGAHAP